MNGHYYDNSARKVDRRFGYSDRRDERMENAPEDRPGDEDFEEPSERFEERQPEPRGERYDDRQPQPRDDRYEDRRYQYEDYDRRPPMPPPISPEVRELRAEVARLSRELDDMKRRLADQAADIRQEKDAREDILAKTENISATIDDEQIGKITGPISALDGKLGTLDANLNSNIKNAKNELSESMDERYQNILDKLRSLTSKNKENDNEELIAEIDKIQGAVSDKITEKFGTRNIGDVLKKLSSLQTLVMASMIGTILTLVIVCYLILSLS